MQITGTSFFTFFSGELAYARQLFPGLFLLFTGFLYLAAPRTLAQSTLPDTLQHLSLPTGNTQEKENEKLQQALESERQELELIRTQIAEQKRQITQLERREGTLQSRLVHLEKKLRLSDRLIRALKARSIRLNQEITRTIFHLTVTQQQLKSQKTIFADLLRGYWKNRASAGLNFDPLMATPLGVGQIELTPSNKVQPQKNLSRCIQTFHSQIGAVLETQGQLMKTRANLEARHQEVLATKRETERQERARQQDLKKYAQLLRELRQEKKRVTLDVAELESSARELEQIIARLEQQRQASQGAPGSLISILPPGQFLSQKGKMLWPVIGKLVSTFGVKKDPVRKTATFQPGLDIEVEPNTTVRAVSTGVVIYVGWLRGYDNFVILQHDSGYYTLYAHLEQIFVKVGNLLKTSQPLGTVAPPPADLNQTGRFHFEVRQGKKQLDPQDWLK